MAELARETDMHTRQKYRVVLLVLLSISLLCSGCGTTTTTYYFSSTPTEAQKKQISQIVESTAKALKLKREDSFLYDENKGSSGYSDGTLFWLDIWTREYGRSVAIRKNGERKDGKFIKAEDIFTHEFRRIDQNIDIKTGYEPPAPM